MLCLLQCPDFHVQLLLSDCKKNLNSQSVSVFQKPLLGACSPQAHSVKAVLH